MRCYDEACVPEIIYNFEWISLHCFELYAMTIFGELIIIYACFRFLRNVTSRLCENSHLFKKFLCRENGVLQFMDAFSFNNGLLL